MRDFSAIAPQIGGSLRRLEQLLRDSGFFLSEELSSRTASEIWLRRVGVDFLAVRIDWLGHSGHASHAHYHLEGFPAHRRFEYEHLAAFRRRGRRAVLADITRYDSRSGLPIRASQHEPQHEPLLRDDR
jgi:hypothetical protein